MNVANRETVDQVIENESGEHEAEKQNLLPERVEFVRLNAEIASEHQNCFYERSEWIFKVLKDDVIGMRIDNRIVGIRSMFDGSQNRVEGKSESENDQNENCEEFQEGYRDFFEHEHVD